MWGAQEKSEGAHLKIASDATVRRLQSVQNAAARLIW